MTGRRKNTEPLRAEIERVLQFGCFIRYDAMFAFTDELEKVERELKALTAAGEAERALALYEIYLAGCYEKIEECDDSSGGLGIFWDTLFRGWVVARQAAGCPAAETIRLILKWKSTDQYGFCYDIEKEVAQILDAEAYQLLVAHLQKLLDGGLESLQGPKPATIFEYDNAIRLPAMSLKEVYLARGDAASYAALSERLGLSPRDCQHLAEMEKAKRRWKQALDWVEKGLALAGARNWHNEAGYSLDELRIDVLARLGRKDEALDQAWVAFEKDPSVFKYEDLMRLAPKNAKRQWQERALESSETGDLGDYMELCAKTKEWDRLATRVLASTAEGLEAVSHYSAEPAARGLAKRNLAAAAALHRAMGFRVLSAKKSKYYGAALKNFKNARALYRKAGMESEWLTTVSRVRAEHGRKYGFMGDFERLEAGTLRAEPTFEALVSERLKTISGR